MTPTVIKATLLILAMLAVLNIVAYLLVELFE